MNKPAGFKNPRDKKESLNYTGGSWNNSFERNDEKWMWYNKSSGPKGTCVLPSETRLHT